jgi:nicotinamidase-related amidase
MTYDRLTASNAAVLFVDHQTGLANGVQTQSPPEFINNVKALVTIAQIYKLPSIITTSAADGPNGPIMPVVAEGHSALSFDIMMRLGTQNLNA